MSSVTARIKQIKQPRGGYINPKLFEVREMENSIAPLNEEENVHAAIIGIVVDYLARYVMEGDKEEAFRISLKGATRAAIMQDKRALKTAKGFVENINGLDDTSIINACKVATFDVWLRDPMAAMMAKGHNETNPDKNTIHNIKTMVERSVAFWDKYGEIKESGFTFETNGYTETVDSGDGDYLTSDTMLDFKVSKAKPTNKHTLQIVMYWIMGQHSGKKEFKSITKVGFFNPRLNNVNLLDVVSIPNDVIEAIENNVICY